MHSTRGSVLHKYLQLKLRSKCCGSRPFAPGVRMRAVKRSLKRWGVARAGCGSYFRGRGDRSAALLISYGSLAVRREWAAAAASRRARTGSCMCGGRGLDSSCGSRVRQQGRGGGVRRRHLLLQLQPLLLGGLVRHRQQKRGDAGGHLKARVTGGVLMSRDCAKGRAGCASR